MTMITHSRKNVFDLVSIDNICLKISSGGTPSRLHPEFFTYENEGHLWVKSKELLDRSINDTEEKITDEGLKHSSARYYPKNSILLAMYGANVCQLGWLKRPATINQAICGMIVNELLADPRFIFYAFLSTRNQLSFKARGAAQQNLNLDLVRSFEIPFPPPPTQQKIAAILSTYDDLIDNNTQRIKILEEMTQAIYREWFVNFRFPGHEGLRMVESELGPVPEGWEVGTVEETFEISGGGTPSTKVPEYWDSGTINWYSPTDLTTSKTMFMDFSGNQISESGLKKSSARLFKPFSVMMTSRATLGVISINTTEACTNQGFITCIPNERFPLLVLFYWLKENVEYFISLGTGSTFKEITKGVFKTIKLVVPPSEVGSQFEDTVQPLALQILNLQRKNANLRRTRDLLLPKLISGELDMSGMDIRIPEAKA